MINTLVEILNNATGPIEIKTDAIVEITEAVFEATGRVIKRTQAIYYYFNDDGYSRQRKLKNTYEISLQKNEL